MTEALTARYRRFSEAEARGYSPLYEALAPGVAGDTRQDYGEDRYQALAEGLDGKPYVVVFTMRGNTMWVISFHRAHAKAHAEERRTYGEKA
jgi:uncharacterized DUF497 family protein